MSSPILPLELCELVIDLIDDQDALRACSLACKASIPACRRHLFYRVRLFSRRIANRFIRSISSIPSPTSPYRHIQHLYLREEARPERQWVNNALPLFKFAILDITTLELYRVKWNRLDQTGQASLLSGFQEVKHLEISHGGFDTSEQMNHFIGSFPLLTELSCAREHWRTDSAPTALLTPLPHGLHAITLAACQSAFFHQLLTLKPRSHVRSVSFEYWHSMDLYIVGIFLKVLGPNLEELDLGTVPYATYDHSHHQRPEEVVLKINLSHNTHLRYIHVTSFGLCGGSIKWLTALFSQVLSPHVVYISLKFQLEDFSTLGSIDWTEVEHEFTQPRWTNLRKLALLW